MRRQQHIVGNLGQVVLILAPLTQISEIEQETILKLLQEMRHHHPGEKINNAYSFFFLVYLFTRIFSSLCISKRDLFLYLK